MTTFLDTNVLLAALNDQEPHHEWAVEQIETSKAKGPTIVSNVVYCEFSVGMATKDDVDAAIDELGLERLAEDDEVLFRAGKAFKKYREQHGGQKVNVLADFLIGAMAEVSGGTLVTANGKDFVGYFPNLGLVTP